MWKISNAHLKSLVYGGAVLGGGGGGSINAGLEEGRRALAAGSPYVAELGELPEKARVVTLSRVGPVGKSSGDIIYLDEQFERALDLFKQSSGTIIEGLIPSEIGPLAVTYGWRESALTGLPIVDAPANGRAHPLGVMGSLGLHRKPLHKNRTIVVGAKPGTSNYIELSIKANARYSAQLVRNTASDTQSSLAVVRNLLPIWYVRRHAAIGGIKYAYRVGKEIINHQDNGFPEILRALSQLMGGRVLAQGIVVNTDLSERNGFTLGAIDVQLATGDFMCLPVCNEFMLILQRGSVLASFPDLITVFDQKSALPLSSTEVRSGSRIAIFVVPRRHLLLSSPMSDLKLLRPIERLLNISFPSGATIQQSMARQGAL